MYSIGLDYWNGVEISVIDTQREANCMKSKKYQLD